MSYFDDNEDYIVYGGFDRQERRAHRRDRYTTPAADRIWTMIDGTRIRMGDMEPSHRGNAYRMLERRHGALVTAMSPTGRALRELGFDDD